MTAPIVCTPLGAERTAVRRALPRAIVLRTGMGPQRSAAAAARLAAHQRPIAVAGVAGGLADGVRPGDLVVADQVWRDGAAEPAAHSPAAPMVAGALRRLGLRVHVGPIVSATHVVDGAERADLAASGALAVDMESAWLAAAAPSDRCVVVRAVADAAGQPLRRPGTAWRGLRALRALRAAGPAIALWADALADREVVLAGPRSFCAGVDRAIEIVERALDRYGPPVYVRRQIVHNAHVVRELRERGAVFVEEVDEVPPGSVLVLAAHGVAPPVRQAAAERELSVIDATCPLVTKVHSEVRRYAARGDTVLLIGHRDHEEVVGTHGEAPDHVVVVEDPDQAGRVEVPDPGRVAYAMQTTLAVDEAEQTAGVLRQRFPSLAGPRKDDICYATSNRQDAVRAIAGDSDLLLVVGSANSSNSHRLVEVAQREGVPAYLVDDAEAVDLRWLQNARRVGLTAGASAPPRLVDELVHCLSGLGEVAARENHIVQEDVEFTLPREVS